MPESGLTSMFRGCCTKAVYRALQQQIWLPGRASHSWYNGCRMASFLGTHAPTQTPVMPPPAKEKEQDEDVWRTMGMLREDCSVC